MAKKCKTDLFSDTIQPPEPFKSAWRKMIPDWAWQAMVDDTVQVLEKEADSPKEDIERRIRNKHVFIRREAFFPVDFLPDVVKEACMRKKK